MKLSKRKDKIKKLRNVSYFRAKNGKTKEVNTTAYVSEREREVKNARVANTHKLAEWRMNDGNDVEVETERVFSDLNKTKMENE